MGNVLVNPGDFTLENLHYEIDEITTSHYNLLHNSIVWIEVPVPPDGQA